MNQVAERERLPDRADDEQWERGQAQPIELFQPTDITLTMVPSTDRCGANPRPTEAVVGAMVKPKVNARYANMAMPAKGTISEGSTIDIAPVMTLTHRMDSENSQGLLTSDRTKSAVPLSSWVAT